jgi:hypothetical protein
MQGLHDSAPCAGDYVNISLEFDPTHNAFASRIDFVHAAQIRASDWWPCASAETSVPIIADVPQVGIAPRGEAQGYKCISVCAIYPTTPPR